MSIKFYATGDLYGEFSNFALFPFKLDGKIWLTSEHYFQAQKFVDEAYREKIREAKSPLIAAWLGRSRTVPLRPDWEDIKTDVMRRAVRAKLEAHEELIRTLLSTSNQEIIEDAKGDSFWGCGVNGKGKNWLGKILMEIRDELRQHADLET